MTNCEIPEIVSTKNYFWNVYLLFNHLDAWWNCKKKPQTKSDQRLQITV